jgi:two-component system NtrC family response regulator
MRLSSTVQQRLTSYSWPGNVRQLENILERLLVLSSSDLITAEDLPEELILPSATVLCSGPISRKRVLVWKRSSES